MARVRERAWLGIVAAVVLVAVSLALIGCGEGCGDCAVYSFRDLAAESGLVVNHSVDLGGLTSLESQTLAFAGGVAAADYDGDGWIDLYAIGGAIDGNRLFHNRSDGTFEDVTDTAGVARRGENSAGAVFVDYDGDAKQDVLAVGDFGSTRAFIGNGDGSFTGLDSALFTDENGMGTTTGDFDGDGDIDWFVTSIFGPAPAANGSWGTSGNRLYRNEFARTSELAGGNRPGLVANRRGASPSFVDGTEHAGVRIGHWGWGTCSADFDRDGDLDIYQVNGIDFGSESESAPFHDNPALFYVNDGNGAFSERAAEAGIDDRGQGRGVACFDYDRDGDIDIAVSNTNGPLRLFRNDSRAAGHYLTVKLMATPPNPDAIGARVTLHAADGSLQVREIRAGGGFVSSDPPEAHFGIPSTAAKAPQRLVVRGPHGCESEITGFNVDRALVIELSANGCALRAVHR